MGSGATPTAQRVVVQRSTGSAPGSITPEGSVQDHVRRADPHPQYYLESEAADDLAAIEADVAALEGRADALEAAQARTVAEAGDPFIIPDGRQVAVYGSLLVEDDVDVEVNGELVIHG